MKDKIVVKENPGMLKLFCDGRTPSDTPAAHPVPPNHIFVDGVATRDVLVNEETGVWVRIYLPEKKKKKPFEKLPLVIHFGGGGLCFTHDDWRKYYYFYSRLTTESQVVIVSVQYRMSPEHHLAAACEDCFDVLEWIRSVAELKEKKQQWLIEHADFRRSFLMGESAGANLVHQAALAYAAATENDNNNDNPFCLRGSILFRPGFVKSELSRSEESVPKSALVTVEMIDGMLKRALPEGSRDHPICNPIGPRVPHVEGIKLPKMLVAISAGDSLRKTQKEFCEAMINAGQDVEVVIVSEYVDHYVHVDEIAIAQYVHTAAQASNLLAAVDHFIKIS